MFNCIKKEMIFAGKKLSLETGLLANQADGSVFVQYGDTSILCTVVSDKKDSNEVDFFPLSVYYIEKQYAGGIIPRSFFKREGKQSEREILISRLIDRSIRPMFVDGFFRNTQIICTLLSYDKISEPDFPALIGTAAAIGLAKLPMKGIVGGCRVGYINNEYVINPNNDVLKNSDLDLFISGTENSILMVESQANQLDEEIMLNAVNFGHSEFSKVIELIKEFISESAVNKTDCNFISRDKEALYTAISNIAKDTIIEAYKISDKALRRKSVLEIYSKLESIFLCKNTCDTKESNNCTDDNSCSSCPCDSFVFLNGEPQEVTSVDLKLSFEKLQEDVVKDRILNEGIRIDGRSTDEIRPIDIKIDILPIVHGSALFTRGGTQVLAVTTLGGSLDEQQSDSLSDPQSTEKFLLHYNFPGYSAGETTPPRAPGRREIGHGRLAYRSISPVLPSKIDFPYTIRAVGEVMSSDGSTSMATVCSTVMSLMATGVPIKAPVAGIAMGLIVKNNNYQILTDIMADEDHLGDMDFKVAGTINGITALQMDIKIDGITKEIMKDALEKAKIARLKILSKMSNVLESSRKDISANAPRFLSMNISIEKIPELIGKSGSNIKSISEKSGAKIEIEQTGKVNIFADSDANIEIAKGFISAICDPLEFGAVLNGKIKNVIQFGAIVDVGFDRTGLVHISEIANQRIENIDQFIKIGDEVKVKYIGLDDKRRPKFSIRAVDQTTGLDISNESYSQKNDSSDRTENRERGNFRNNRGSSSRDGGRGRSAGRSYSRFDKGEDRPKRRNDGNNFGSSFFSKKRSGTGNKSGGGGFFSKNKRNSSDSNVSDNEMHYSDIKPKRKKRFGIF